MPFDHFIKAQEGVYPQVVRELRAGQKLSHWMWFIFPQVRGLGFSETSRFFALASIDEARRYLEHAVLGARLRECTQLVIDTDNRTADEIFGAVDALKFRSSMTLFALCAKSTNLFDLALDKYYGGKREPKTLEILDR